MYLDEKLEIFIDVIPSNPISINKSDFSDECLNYFFVHDKFENLIKDNLIGPSDRLSNFIFEPKSLRKEFYANIKALKLTNYNKVSYTRIDNLQDTLENKIV